MEKIAALFDCDGTLYAAQYGRGLMQYAAQNGRKRLVRALYASLLVPHLLHKYQLISTEAYNRPLVSRLARLAKGMDEAEFCQASEWLVREYLLPTEKPEVTARLRQHQVKGHLVVFVSAQFTPSLELLGAHYRADGLVGTRMEVKSARYTGRVTPPVITGKDKDPATRAYLAARGETINWEASYAYADSIADASLFNMVGHPVAVSPDPKLLALAQKNDWEKIGTARNQSK